MSKDVIESAVVSMVDDTDPARRQESFGFVYTLVDMTTQKVDATISSFLGNTWRHTIPGSHFTAIFHSCLFEAGSTIPIEPPLTRQRVQQLALTNYLWGFFVTDTMEAPEDYPFVEVAAVVA